MFVAHVSTQKGGVEQTLKMVAGTRCLLTKMKENVTSPSNFVATTIKKEIFAFVMLQHYKRPKHCTLQKNKLKSFFMFVVFTLHQT
jgi:hypothetical protein